MLISAERRKDIMNIDKEEYIKSLEERDVSSSVQVIRKGDTKCLS